MTDTQSGDISNQSEDQYNKELAGEGPIAKRLGAAAGKYDQQQGREVSTMSSRLEGGRSRLASLDSQLEGMPKPPEMQLTPPPQPQQTSPEQIWGSLAMILAGVGSLKSRGHMTTALNAAASVMNAYHKNDQEAYQAAYQTWKASNDNAIKIAQYEQKTYGDALRRISEEGRLALGEGNLDVRETEAHLRALAHSYQDPLMQERLRNEGLKGAHETLKERERQLKKIDDATKKAAQHARTMYKGMNLKQAWDAYGKSAEGQLLKQQNPTAYAAKFFEMQRQIAPETDTRGDGSEKDRKAAAAAYKSKYGQQAAFGKAAKSPDDFYRDEWKTYGDPKPEPGSDKPMQGPNYFMKRGAATPDQARADAAAKNKDDLPNHNLFEDGAAVHVKSPAEAQKLPPGTPYITPDGKQYTR